MNRYSERKFLILLVTLGLLLVVQPQVAELPAGPVILSFLGSLLQITVILSLFQTRKQRAFALVFGILTIVAIWSKHYFSDANQVTALVLGHSFTAVFLAITAMLTLRYVLTHDVTSDNVLGAICAYLLIGVAMAQVYFVLETLQPRSFLASDRIAKGLSDPNLRGPTLMYYSFTALTTSGFGDIFPGRPLTRTLAWMEAVTGQFYLALLVAGMVGMRVSQKLAKDHGPATPPRDQPQAGS